MLIQEPVVWNGEEGKVKWLLQTLLPGEVVYKTSSSYEDIYHAIQVLDIRGAPLIGIGAAYGIAAHVLHSEGSIPQLYEEAKKSGNRLVTARPTAVNLSWAVNRMLVRAKSLLSNNVSTDEFKKGIVDEAISIDKENSEMTNKIGEYGSQLLSDGDVVLAHCNAGTLACGGIGTNLAPIRVAIKQGKRIKVVQTWTGPLFQGARLTMWELKHDGTDSVLIPDTSVAYALGNLGITKVIVGADRILMNGSVANKIGTFGIAIIAKHFKIPFYVAAPTSTIDRKSRSIPIEQRNPEEVTDLLGKLKIAPEGIRVANPAFDITSPKFITGIITEKGIISPPYRKNISQILYQN